MSCHMVAHDVTSCHMVSHDVTWSHLKDLFMGGHLLEGNQAVQHNEFDVVVTFLHNQLNIAL